MYLFLQRNSSFTMNLLGRCAPQPNHTKAPPGHLLLEREHTLCHAGILAEITICTCIRVRLCSLYCHDISGIISSHCGFDVFWLERELALEVVVHMWMWSIRFATRLDDHHSGVQGRQAQNGLFHFGMCCGIGLPIPGCWTYGAI